MIWLSKLSENNRRPLRLYIRLKKEGFQCLLPFYFYLFTFALFCLGVLPEASVEALGGN